MALSDIYYQQPWNPQAAGQQQMQQGLGLAAKMPMEQAQLQAQQQANTDAQYNAPGRPANPYEQQLSGDVLDLFPGPDHFKQQLRSEMQGQGGPSAPGQGLQAPPQQGPSAPPAQNLGPSGYGQPAIGMGGYASSQQPQPYGPPVSQMPQTSVYRGPLDDQSTLSATTGSIGSSAPAPQAPAPKPPAPPTPRLQPQTRGDVDMTMRMAPFLKANHDDPRIAINDANLKYKREALAQRQKLAEMADQTRRELARLMAMYRQNPNDKLLIAQIHEAAANHRAAMGDKARMDSGLGGVIDQPGAQEQKRAEDKADIEAQKEYHDLVDQASNRGRGQSSSGGASGPQGARRIAVVDKKTGQKGTILPSEWDPAIYSKAP
jgi:hypothetical protein